MIAANRSARANKRTRSYAFGDGCSSSECSKLKSNHRYREDQFKPKQEKFAEELLRGKSILIAWPSGPGTGNESGKELSFGSIARGLALTDAEMRVVAHAVLDGEASNTG